jgi:hypothetical protein
MINMRRMISAGVAVALVTTSITPAFAGWRGSGYDYGYSKHKHRRYYKRDKLDTGDVIGILAVVGLVAAIATSGKSKRRERESGGYQSGPYKRGAINSENDAVDALSLIHI